MDSNYASNKQHCSIQSQDSSKNISDKFDSKQNIPYYDQTENYLKSHYAGNSPRHYRQISEKIKTSAVNIVKQLRSRLFKTLKVQHYNLINDLTQFPPTEDQLLKNKSNVIFPFQNQNGQEIQSFPTQDVNQSKIKQYPTESQTLNGGQSHEQHQISNYQNKEGNFNNSTLNKKYVFFHFSIQRNFKHLIQHYFDKIPVFNPSSNYKIIWDLIIFIVTGILVFFIPIHIIYGFSFTQLMGGILESVCYILMFVDCLVYLNMGIYRQGLLIKDRTIIFKYWLRKLMIQDFVSISPIAFSFIYRSRDNDDFPIIMRFFMLLFFNKIGRLMKIANKLQETFVISIKINNLIGLIKLLLFSVFMGHVFSSIFLYVGIYEVKNEYPGTWLQAKSILEEDWLTIGYGDVTPTTKLEMFYCIFLMFVACGVFGYTLNAINQIFDGLYKQETEKKHKLCIINNYMQKKNVSTDLQYQIREYLSYVWKENLENLDDEKKIINQLSNQLKQKLLLDANQLVLQLSPIFKNNFSQNILQKTGQLIQECKFTPEEIIYNKLDKDDSAIYFIVSGSIDMFINNVNFNNQNYSKQGNRETQSIHQLKKGQSFGMMSFFTGLPRNSSIRSREFTTLLSIKRNDFINLLKEFPYDYERFCHIKDSILLYNLLGQGCIQCLSCGSKNYILNNCPLVHYIPNKNKLVAQINLNIPQHRNKNFIRSQYTLQALKNSNILVNDLLDFHEKYEQLLDDYEVMYELEQQFNQPLDEEEQQQSVSAQSNKVISNEKRESLKNSPLKLQTLNEVQEEKFDGESSKTSSSDSSDHSQNEAQPQQSSIDKKTKNQFFQNSINNVHQDKGDQPIKSQRRERTINNQEKFTSVSEQISTPKKLQQQLVNADNNQGDEVDFFTINLNQQMNQTDDDQIIELEFEDNTTKYPKIFILTPEDWELKQNQITNNSLQQQQQQEVQPIKQQDQSKNLVENQLQNQIEISNPQKHNYIKLNSFDTNASSSEQQELISLNGQAIPSTPQQIQQQKSYQFHQQNQIEKKKSLIVVDRSKSRMLNKQSSKIIEDIDQNLIPKTNKQVFRRSSSIRNNSYFKNSAIIENRSSVMGNQTEKIENFSSISQQQSENASPNKDYIIAIDNNKIVKKKSILTNDQHNSAYNIQQQPNYVKQRLSRLSTLITAQQQQQLQAMHNLQNSNRRISIMDKQIQQQQMQDINANDLNNNITNYSGNKSINLNTNQMQLTPNDLVQILQQFNLNQSKRQANEPVLESYNKQESEQESYQFAFNFDLQKNFMYYFPHNNLIHILNSITYQQQDKKKKNIFRNLNSKKKTQRLTIFGNQFKGLKKQTINKQRPSIDKIIESQQFSQQRQEECNDSYQSRCQPDSKQHSRSNSQSEKQNFNIQIDKQ